MDRLFLTEFIVEFPVVPERTKVHRHHVQNGHANPEYPLPKPAPVRQAEGAVLAAALEHFFPIAPIVPAGVLRVGFVVLFVGCADLLSVCSVVSAFLLQDSFPVFAKCLEKNKEVLSTVRLRTHRTEGFPVHESPL